MMCGIGVPMSGYLGAKTRAPGMLQSFCVGEGCVAWRLASTGPPAGWLSVAFVAAEDAGKMGPGWGVVASESGGNWAVQEMEVRYVASLREPAAPKT